MNAWGEETIPNTSSGKQSSSLDFLAIPVDEAGGFYQQLNQDIGLLRQHVDLKLRDMMVSGQADLAMMDANLREMQGDASRQSRDYGDISQADSNVTEPAANLSHSRQAGQIQYHEDSSEVQIIGVVKNSPLVTVQEEMEESREDYGTRAHPGYLTTHHMMENSGRMGGEQRDVPRGFVSNGYMKGDPLEEEHLVEVISLDDYESTGNYIHQKMPLSNVDRSRRQDDSSTTTDSSENSGAALSTSAVRTSHESINLVRELHCVPESRVVSGERAADAKLHSRSVLGEFLHQVGSSQAREARDLGMSISTDVENANDEETSNASSFFDDDDNVMRARKDPDGIGGRRRIPKVSPKIWDKNDQTKSNDVQKMQSTENLRSKMQDLLLATNPSTQVPQEEALELKEDVVLTRKPPSSKLESNGSKQDDTKKGDEQESTKKKTRKPPTPEAAYGRRSPSIQSNSVASSEPSKKFETRVDSEKTKVPENDISSHKSRTSESDSKMHNLNSKPSPEAPRDRSSVLHMSSNNSQSKQSVTLADSLTSASPTVKEEAHENKQNVIEVDSGVLQDIYQKRKEVTDEFHKKDGNGDRDENNDTQKDDKEAPPVRELIIDPDEQSEQTDLDMDGASHHKERLRRKNQEKSDIAQTSNGVPENINLSERQSHAPRRNEKEEKRIERSRALMKYNANPNSGKPSEAKSIPVVEDNRLVLLQQVQNKIIRDPYGDEGRYTGVMVSAKPHGQGTMNYRDGRLYSGEWRQGRWHGHGHAIFANGDSYIGQYENDQRHGHGRYEWADGRVYDGGFKFDHRQGPGSYTWPDGAVYTGDFAKGLRHGKGRYIFADGSCYMGGWKEGKYHGQGECVWSDGRKYSGNWYKGMAHGKGIEHRPDGTVRHEGEWRRDRPIRPKKES